MWRVITNPSFWRHVLLQLLDRVVGELDDPSAALADQVIVMVLVLDVLEPRLAVVEMALGSERRIRGAAGRCDTPSRSRPAD